MVVVPVPEHFERDALVAAVMGRKVMPDSTALNAKPFGVDMAQLSNIPASFFGIALGLAGLGGSWRAAHVAWRLPAVFGEVLMLLAAVAWATVTLLYVVKWIRDRDAALAEMNIRCSAASLALQVYRLCSSPQAPCLTRGH
jgi:hypothetical protein